MRLRMRCPFSSIMVSGRRSRRKIESTTMLWRAIRGFLIAGFGVAVAVSTVFCEKSSFVDSLKGVGAGSSEVVISKSARLSISEAEGVKS